MRQRRPATAPLFPNAVLPRPVVCERIICAAGILAIASASDSCANLILCPACRNVTVKTG